MTARTDRLRLWFLSLFILTMTGCQVMDSSVDYNIRPDGSQARGCNSALGSYALPLSTIEIKVLQDYKGTSPVGGPRLTVDKPAAHPDPRHLYCLNFLENGFSDDQVTVAFAGKNDASGTAALPNPVAATGLLSVIASKSVDRTGEVIRNVIRAIFILASRNASFDFGRAGNDVETTATVTDQSVNPFDLAGMAALNRSLHDSGYCITFGKYTYDVDRLKPDAYCNNPDLPLAPSSKPPFLQAAEGQKYLVSKLPAGVFYRPRQPYSMFVYVRDDPERGGPWELRKIDTVMLENLSPILVLKVNRTVFAEYRTLLAFDNGNLVDVCIGKGSEVAGALQIPLDIVYGLVSLPSDTIVKEIENKRYTAELISKQKELITLQNSILKASAGTIAGADGTVAGASLGKDSKTGLVYDTAAPADDSYGKIKQIDNVCPLLKTTGG